MKNQQSPFLSDEEFEAVEFESSTGYNYEHESPLSFDERESDYEFADHESPFMFEDKSESIFSQETWDNTGNNFELELDHESVETMLKELKDEEFNKAMYDVVSEIRSQIYTPFLLHEFDQQETPQDIAERYISPVRFELENFFNHIEQETGERPIESLSDNQIEQLFEGYYSENEALDEKQLFLFESTKRKAKKAAKAAKKAEKKTKKNKKGKKSGVIMKKVIAKIKPIAMKLLDKLIQKGIDKSPEDIRPALIELKEKLLAKAKLKSQENDNEDTGSNTTFIDNSTTVVQTSPTEKTTEENDNDDEATETEAVDAAALPSVEDTQDELDLKFVQALTSNEFETDQAFDNFFTDYESTDWQQNEFEFFDGEFDNETSNNIENARENFIYELSNLQEGESSQPIVENFVMEALKVAKMALKPIIKSVGVDKVAAWVAKPLTGLISKFISPENAQKLAVYVSKAAIKKAFNMEFEYETSDGQMAYEAIADAVQNVAQRVANMPTEAFMNEELLAHETQQAFAAAFPDNLIREEYREAQTTSGMWQTVAMPNGQRKYSKYSQTFEVVLNANKLKFVKTFGGQRLDDFLRNRMGISLDGQTAQVHLYEAMPNCMLSDIALNETAIASLGTAGQESYSQIHPLTPAAAAILTNEVGLASDDDDQYLQSPLKIREGQRFYVLEIAGAGRVGMVRNENELKSFEIPPTLNSQIADKIIRTRNVEFLKFHVSGANDPDSTAYANIMDTLNNKSAKTSNYGHARGKRVSLDTNMLKGLWGLAKLYSFRITALAGSKHSPNSRHYAGLTFDVDIINGQKVSSSNPFYKDFMQKCKALGATEVLGPGNKGHGGHIHAAWPRNSNNQVFNNPPNTTTFHNNITFSNNDRLILIDVVTENQLLFESKVKEIAKRLQLNPNWLMMIMYLESHLNHKAYNKNGGATGLIQFMPRTASEIGTSTASLKNMTNIEQLKWVEKYFSTNLNQYGSKVKDWLDLYIITFYPRETGNDSFSLPSKVVHANNLKDIDGDGKITIKDFKLSALKRFNRDVNSDPKVRNKVRVLEFAKI